MLLTRARPAAPAPPLTPSPDAGGGADTRDRQGSRLGRSTALDRLRGIALVAMLVHHLVEWSTGDARAVLPGWRTFTVTDAAAVAFFVAAGGSMALFASSRRRRGLARRRIAAQVVRRYGLLVPIGMALDWVLWRDPLMCGVLEVLGVSVVLAAAVSLAVPPRLLPVVAGLTVWAGVWSEHAVGDRTSWWAAELVGGKFPIVTYVGFVLVGVAAVRGGWHARPRTVAVGAVVGCLAVVGMLLDGLVPARYPGDVHFVVPGLAITVAAYAVAQARWGSVLGAVDRVVREAAAHTLGIFVAHYGIYAVLRHAGLLGDVAPVVAVPAAFATTVLLCLAAPRVPVLPWSARTGVRRQPARSRS